MNYTNNNNQKVKISFTGDVMCEYTRLGDYYIDGKYDFTDLFSSCSGLFAESDYVVANLETPIAGEKLKYSYKNYNFNTPESILTAMKKSGIDMVTTANNHVLDRGIEGVDQTIAHIRKNGLDYVGSSTTGETPKPLIKNINGIKIAFLSYTYGTEACYNHHYLKRKDQYRVNLLQNQELSKYHQRFILKSKNIIAKGIRFILKRMNPKYFSKPVEEYKQSDGLQKRHLLNEIKYCRQNNVDTIIMCLHSGGQFNDEPTKNTEQVVQFCLDHGIKTIICNHEHLIQKIDCLSDGIVAYCLGNYTSNYGIDRPPYDKEAQCSAVLHLYLIKGKQIEKEGVSFSLILSVKKQGKIVSIPLYDYYSQCDNNEEKEKLENLNIRCLERVLNRKISFDIEPQKEYFFSFFDN